MLASTMLRVTPSLLVLTIGRGRGWPVSSPVPTASSAPRLSEILASGAPLCFLCSACAGGGGVGSESCCHGSVQPPIAMVQNTTATRHKPAIGNCPSPSQRPTRSRALAAAVLSYHG